MSFLNTYFSSVDDLKDVDTQIAHLETSKEQIDAAVANRTSDTVNNSKSHKVEHLLAELKQTPSVSDPVEHLNSLTAQYGLVDSIKTLQTLTNRQLETKKAVEFLRNATAIENSITTVDISKKDDVEAIIASMNDLDSENPLYATTFDQLNQKLNDEISLRKEELSAQLTAILDDNWLKKPSLSPAKSKEISSCFRLLVELQTVRGNPEYPETFWALDILIKPVVTRFYYHFMVNKDTNRLSKPEWAFNYIETFLADQAQYIDLVVGGILESHNRITMFEIVTSILVPVRAKLVAMVKIINEKLSADESDKYGRILSHLIFELTSFDQRLRTSLHYNPYIEDLKTPPVKKWLGLTGDVLLTDTVAANNWLNFEFKLAKQRFDTEIVSFANWFEIDFDFHGEGKGDLLKPTYSASNLIKLFNNLTSHYSTLSIVKYQLKYVSNIQLKFIDEYLSKIKLSLRSFNDTFNLKTVLNFIPGGLDTETVSGSETVANALKGLEVLTGLYCLTRFVHSNLEDWSEELIFIQLWKFYSTLSGPVDNHLSIFDSAISQCEALEKQMLGLYKKFFRKETKNALKDYVNSSQWNLTNAIGECEPSSALSYFITTIPVYLGFVKKAVSVLDYFCVANDVVTMFCELMHEYIVTNNRFSQHGIKQFETDIDFCVAKLKDELFLYSDPENYSTKSNHLFLKLTQSIEFLTTIDSGTAKLLKKQFQEIPHLRSRFPHLLDHLTDHEVNDLLYRIV